MKDTKSRYQGRCHALIVLLQQLCFTVRVVTNKGFITSVVFQIEGGTPYVPFLYAVSSLAMVEGEL